MDTSELPHSTKRPAASRTATLTAAEGLRAIEQGALTSVAWTEACLERIESRNPEIRAWVHVNADAALEHARQTDRRGRRRLFDGVPLGIKDTIDTADMPTELGDPEIFPGRQPAIDAPVVSMARDLGFTIIGKNTVSRHAIMLPGPARNPHDLARTPAASSAGSAAAVADFMTPMSIGTQTAGSILRPSAFCGAVGFKPTLDAIPYVGIRTYSRPLDVIGPICRSVEDATLFMRGFTRDPRFDTAAPLTRDIRVGVWRTKDWDLADPAAMSIFEQNLESLSAAGAQISTLRCLPCSRRWARPRTSSWRMISLANTPRSSGTTPKNATGNSSPISTWEKPTAMQIIPVRSTRRMNAAVRSTILRGILTWSQCRQLWGSATCKQYRQFRLHSNLVASAQPLHHAPGLPQRGGPAARISACRVCEGGSRLLYLARCVERNSRQHGTRSLGRFITFPGAGSLAPTRAV